MRDVHLTEIQKIPSDPSAPSCEAGSAGGREFSGPEARDRVSNSAIHPRTKLEMFEEVILPHLNAAHNLARWLTRNEQDAQDVVQESYLRALRFFDGYKGGDGKSWLLAVVRDTYFAWRRHEKRSSNDPFDEATHSANVHELNQEDSLVEASKMRVLRDCIEMLPPGFREVIVMRELEEMSYRQISDAACLPVGTVMSRLSRARKRLEECAGGEKRVNSK